MCNKVRQAGQGRFKFSIISGPSSTLSGAVTFDSNGLLNGVAVLLTEEKPVNINVAGYTVSLPPGTAGELTWKNAPNTNRGFAVNSNNAVEIGRGAMSALVSSVSYDGSFHVNGMIFAGIGASAMENALNRNNGAILGAADLGEKLHSSQIPCEDVINALTFLGHIWPY